MPENAKQKVRFSTENVEIWSPDHVEYGRGFACERDEFVEYWNENLANDVRAHVGRAWIIREAGQLAGYITLLTDALTKKVRGQQKRFLEVEGIEYGAIPAIKIGRLARSTEALGAGHCLMDWALVCIAKELAPKVGVRFVTVDALYDADDPDNEYDISKFYERFGFQFVNPEKLPTPKTRYRSMFLDIKALVDEFAKAGR